MVDRVLYFVLFKTSAYLCQAKISYLLVQFVVITNTVKLNDLLICWYSGIIPRAAAVNRINFHFNQEILQKFLINPPAF